MLPIWLYVAVALIIAFVAFGIAQLAPGYGVVFVAIASTMWTAFSFNRLRRNKAG